MKLDKVINIICIFLVIVVILSFFIKELNNYSFIFLTLAVIVATYSLFENVKKNKD